MSAAPLEGLRVVDFTRVLAGPHCTKALRDLGAGVTKIEPPAGDLGRGGLPFVNGIGLYYVQQNAGKRNLSLDLNYTEAREIVLRLCRAADVIVENFRPGTLARFGLGYEDIKAFNPGTVAIKRGLTERHVGETVLSPTYRYGGRPTGLWICRSTWRRWCNKAAISPALRD
jgi:CoA:oxalate CoA-transferase